MRHSDSILETESSSSRAPSCFASGNLFLLSTGNGSLVVFDAVLQGPEWVGTTD